MGRNSFQLQKTITIHPSPVTQLLHHVKANETSEIKRILTANPELSNRIINEPFNKPILQIACCEFANQVLGETVKTLLDLGAELYYQNDLYRHQQALHFAALSGNPKVLQVIVDAIRRNGKTLDFLSDGNTALHLLIRERMVTDKNFVDCVRILIRGGIDVNKKDNKNLTVVWWASKKGYKECVQAIVQESHQVDLDSHRQYEKSARNYIMENNLIALEDLPKPIPDTMNDHSEILFGYLKEFKEVDFVEYNDLANYVNLDNGEITLLQMATIQRLTRAVKKLLDTKADPNKVVPKLKSSPAQIPAMDSAVEPFLTNGADWNKDYIVPPPIEIAAKQGHHAIFHLLLERNDIVIPSNLLIDLVKKTVNGKIDKDVDYNLCYAHLMKHHNKLNVNFQDPYNKNTPLHYVAKYGGANNTLELLRAGASMACKNKYGVLPVQNIDAKTLENHLDECLLETDFEGEIDGKNFTVTYNYKTLMPVTQSKNINKDVVDAEAAEELSIADKFGQLASEMQVIACMSKSSESKHLLTHPLISSFLYLKWHQISCIFYTNLVFYVAFCLSLILYISLVYVHYNDRQEKLFVNSLLFALLLAMFILLSLRELFQITVSPKTYIFNLENFLELSLIVLTALILFQKSPSADTRKQLSAFAILLAAFELVLLIGQDPRMTTNIVMLRKVSFTFSKFLLWYSLLILAFWYSFYTLFRNDDKRNATEEDNGSNFFVGPGLSLVKTIVMLTGEFDAGSIPFDSQPPATYIIFMLFVFMIAIILFNLLNGLAVNDTQLIQSDAELLGYIARAQHIAYIESMFLGDVLPKFIVNCLRKCFCVPLNLADKHCVPRYLLERVCLVPYFLKNYQLKVYMNQHCKVDVSCINDKYYSNGKSKTCLGNCVSNVTLDKETTKRTKELIKQKRETQEKQKCEQTILEQHEQLIQQQQKYIEELKHGQQGVFMKLDHIISNFSANYVTTK